jgi:hypothetical protein
VHSIFRSPGLASCRWLPLSSNVRPHRTEISDRLLSCELLSAGFRSGRKVRTKRKQPNSLGAAKYRHLRTLRIHSGQPRRACKRRFAPRAEAQSQSVKPPKGGNWQGRSRFQPHLVCQQETQSLSRQQCIQRCGFLRDQLSPRTASYCRGGLAASRRSVSTFQWQSSGLAAKKRGAA